MNRRPKKPVRVRRTWKRNPKTQIEDSAKRYKRHKEKKVTLYERPEEDAA